MKNLTATICLTTAVLLGSAGVTLGKEKSISNCSNEDREYAKVWDNYYDPEDAYEFGRKIKKLVKEKQGYVSIHPGNITHRHGARATTKGKRYILVSFMKQNLRT